ncbi:MAG: methyltransferase [Rhodocyclaceae bacterium]|nr:methyltransferase [Rhodocyclaceae bacterium]
MAGITASDFTGLAEDYSSYRPGYSDSVLDALLGLVGKPTAAIDFVDVGAGTGIWTRMVAKRAVASAIAVEPNDDMRSFGERDSRDLPITWRAGSGEATGLADGCCNLLTMASSFHWTNFDSATREFHRLLRPRGLFVALWNPRLIEVNPLLVDIEAELTRLKGGDIKRVSSGRSGITETLTERLSASPYFEDVVYLEGRHVMRQSPEHYLGVWRSVNDLQAQLGTERFARFLDYVSDKVATLPYVEATYLTRAWAARRA